MRTIHRTVVGLALSLFFAATGLGQTVPAAPTPGAAPQPPALSVAAAGLPTGKVIPNVDFNSVPLADVISFLRDADPDFKVMVAFDPGADGGPAISFKAKDVTARDVVSMITNVYPQIDLRTLPSETGASLTVLEVRPSHQPDRILRVYNLSRVVNEHQSMNDVMSLIQACLDLSPSTEQPPVLKVHEPTKALIVCGTPEQLQAVSQAINALIPGGAPSPMAEIQPSLQNIPSAQELQQARLAADHARAELQEYQQALRAAQAAQVEQASKAADSNGGK